MKMPLTYFFVGLLTGLLQIPDVTAKDPVTSLMVVAVTTLAGVVVFLYLRVEKKDKIIQNIYENTLKTNAESMHASVSAMNRINETLNHVKESVDDNAEASKSLEKETRAVLIEILKSHK